MYNYVMGRLNMHAVLVTVGVLVLVIVGFTLGMFLVDNKTDGRKIDDESPMQIDSVATSATQEIVPEKPVSESLDATYQNPTEQMMILDNTGRKTLFYKDSKHVWISGEMPPTPFLIPGADPKTFVPLKYPYSRDAQNVYFWDTPIQSADPMTFRVIYASTDSPFGADQYHVFSGDKIIKGADPSTFEFNPVTFTAKDKSREYDYNVLMFVR